MGGELAGDGLAQRAVRDAAMQHAAVNDVRRRAGDPGAGGLLAVVHDRRSLKLSCDAAVELPQVEIQGPGRILDHRVR